MSDDWVTGSNSGLLTDLYEITMAASYHEQGMTGQATFDLFVRELPASRNFLIVGGLEQALDYLEGLSFDEEATDYLRSLRMFDESFLEYLRGFEFTGEVWAVPEGEAVFPPEPIVRVTAPMIEAQIVETFLLNCITFQTMIASKAARVSLACGDKRFVDFSLRRDHGADAGLKGARASFIGGASGTSNVLAGMTYGIPVSGTMAHSYIMAFESETEAFRAYARQFPERAVLLIDTFDSEEGARRAAQVAKELSSEGIQVNGVRLDSGDLGPLARSVRKILDEAGLGEMQIFLSGDLDEYRIKSLLEEGAPVDAFGVGTQMGTSADAPALGGVYKLVEDERGPKIKLSTGKATLPGRKQVFRFQNEIFDYDLIGLEGEEVPGSRPLLEKVMESGRRLAEPEPLEALQERCRSALGLLPPRLKHLEPARRPYQVQRSTRLDELVRDMRQVAR
ncbi:MAG: nicotinate phosphoribosyltransferase [Actinomycetota bacterium]|jgi:nicotinate phosphoribosyltransferase